MICSRAARLNFQANSNDVQTNGGTSAVFKRAALFDCLSFYLSSFRAHYAALGFHQGLHSFGDPQRQQYQYELMAAMFLRISVLSRLMSS
jgi:hypothetical protein